MRALVTGGAGFIGSNLVDRLINEGHRTYVVDDLSRGSRGNLVQAEKSGQCTFLNISVTDQRLGALMADLRPEVIFHLAARVDVRASVADPVDDAFTNLVGTVNLAEAARKAGTRKVIFASSGGSIYGSPGCLPVLESTPTNPLSPYACSKVCGEVYLNSYRDMYGLDCTHLALSNVYGPRQEPAGEAGVVAIFARTLLGGHTTHVFGDGRNTRDYVYVDDVVDAFLTVAGELGGGKRFNIGTGIQTSDRDLHTLLALAVGAPDQPEFAPARNGDLRASALDSSTAHHHLGWRPQVEISDGIQRTVDYFDTGTTAVPREPTTYASST